VGNVLFIGKGGLPGEGAIQISREKKKSWPRREAFKGEEKKVPLTEERNLMVHSKKKERHGQTKGKRVEKEGLLRKFHQCETKWGLGSLSLNPVGELRNRAPRRRDSRGKKGGVRKEANKKKVAYERKSEGTTPCATGNGRKVSGEGRRRTEKT